MSTKDTSFLPAVQLKDGLCQTSRNLDSCLTWSNYLSLKVKQEFFPTEEDLTTSDCLTKRFSASSGKSAVPRDKEEITFSYGDVDKRWS